MQENISRILKKNIDGLKNLTNAVFDSIFKNIYNIPVPIRITCKIIEILTRQKFKDVNYYKFITPTSLYSSLLIKYLHFFPRYLTPRCTRSLAIFSSIATSFLSLCSHIA